MGLILCAACRRHVRPDERRCPFCGAGTEHESERLRRAVVFALATSLGGCGARSRDDVRPAPVVSSSAAPSASPTASARTETHAGDPARDGALRTVAVYGAPIRPTTREGARACVRLLLPARLLLDAVAQGRIDVMLAFTSDGSDVGGNTNIEGRLPIQVLMCVQERARATVIEHAHSGLRSVRFSVTFAKG